MKTPDKIISIHSLLLNRKYELFKIFVFLIACLNIFFGYADNTPHLTGSGSFNSSTDNYKFNTFFGSYYPLSSTSRQTPGDSIYGGMKYGLQFTDDAFNGNLSVSKGYYPSFIRLQWTPYKINNITQYKIFRRKLTETDVHFQLVQTISNTENSWNDNYAEHGVMYMYKVVAEGLWNKEVPGINMVEGIGFRVTSAVVTGRVTYEGGNLVKGVKVQVIPNTAVNDESDFSYLFKNKVFARVNLNANSSFRDGFSFQMWVQPTFTSMQLLNPVLKFGDISLMYNAKYFDSNTSKYKDGLKLVIGNNLFFADLDKDVFLGFSQLTLTLDNQNKTVKVYVNGKLIIERTININYESYPNEILFGKGSDWELVPRIAVRTVYDPTIDPYSPNFCPDSIKDYDPRIQLSVNYNPELDPTSSSFNWKLIQKYNPQNKNSYYYYSLLDPSSTDFNPSVLAYYDPTDISSPYYLESLDPSIPQFNPARIVSYNPSDVLSPYYFAERDPLNFDFNHNLVPDYNPFDNSGLYYIEGRNPAVYAFYANFIRDYDPKDTTSVYYYKSRDPLQIDHFYPPIIMDYNPKDPNSPYYYDKRNPEIYAFDEVIISMYDPFDRTNSYYTELRDPSSYRFNWDLIRNYNPLDFDYYYYIDIRDPSHSNFDEWLAGNYNPSDKTGVFYFDRRDPSSGIFDWTMVKNYNPKNTASFYYYSPLDPGSNVFDYHLIQDYQPNDTSSPFYLEQLDPDRNPNVNPYVQSFDYSLINFYNPMESNGPYYTSLRDPSDLDFDYQIVKDYSPFNQNSPYYYAPRDPSNIEFDTLLIANYDPSDMNSPYYYIYKDPNFNSTTVNRQTNVDHN